MEDKDLELGDGATKIFLNSVGTADDVTPDVKCFLDYVNGVLSNDDFVQEIDQEIRAVKKLENERVGYMTYAMKMQEERKEGIKEGIKQGREQGQHLANERWGKLMSLLLKEKRYDDAAKAAEDAEFRETLFKEYGI